MDEREIKNNIPMIINKGIIYNPKDILKILRDLGAVNYEQIVNGEIVQSGKAYIVSVVMNKNSANIIVNKKAYLNINGFEYLNIDTTEEETILDLHNDFGILRLRVSNNIESENNNQLPELISPQSIKYFNSQNYDDEDIFVEIIDDDNDED
ncbi:MAG: hypothetical protein KatS3mg068_1118 [Candidatus Sericytochromatia bacterium]|nr:MAG: hypothetical protein KatS3mg068_1118 [Candidatus Sericytochromatia bacterium]